jgi:hypothetical protein
MRRALGGVFGQKAGSAASRSLTALDEPHALQEAMASAAHIMNDGECEHATASNASRADPDGRGRTG